MEENFYFKGSTLQVEYSLTIPVDTNIVWDHLTKTEDIAKWFQEIETGELKPDGYMLFRLPDSEITMPILSFIQDSEIAYEWGGIGSVRFKLTPISEGTKLDFYESLPEDFSHRIRDITGWSLALERLKQTILGKQTTFDMDKFQETENRYREMINNLKL
ncbi:ATPase [Alicyclobacillus contaminans]|nr:SRPBCC domain-containing protein [Tetragenococcus osmophilus]GMA53535.1 ATPase [Alicyclobacillus contaminans]GMA72522.1 ATPase [Tetragenococcus osmophilus]